MNLKTVIEQSLIDQGAEINWDGIPSLWFGDDQIDASKIVSDVLAWLGGA